MARGARRKRPRSGRAQLAKRAEFNRHGTQEGPGLLAQRDLPLRDMLDRYELYIYKQWLRVYMRSKMIKHNKDLFESLDDPLALLEKLHIY